jgi:hypothetical protein
MHMRRSVVALSAAVAVSAAGWGWAGPAPAAPPAPAPAKPAEPGEIERLIKELGDDSFEVREAAGRRLAEIGAPALPALRKAADAADPEVRNRARRLVETLEPPVARPRPDAAPPANPFGPRVGGGVQLRMQILGDNGAKELRVTENDRSVRIREDADGIKVEVTEPDAAGKPATKEYKAKDAAELKKNHPEAAEIYEKYAGRMNVRILNGAGLPGVPNRPRAFGQPNPRLEEYRRRVEEMLRNLGPQGGVMLRELQELERLQQKMLEENGDLRKLMDEVRRAQERLLRGLNENGNPVPPGAPAPPPGAPAEQAPRPRLGVEMAEPDETLRSQLGLDGGVIVRRVLPGSRADKLGLREHDILLKLNDRPITGAEQFRGMLEEEKRFRIEGLRGGKPFKAEEPE